MSSKTICPLSEKGLKLIRAHEAEANGQPWASYYRKWLSPEGALGKDGIEQSIMSKLRAISPTSPGGKYTGNTPAYEQRLERALNLVREHKRHQVAQAQMMTAFLDLPRFAPIYSGIERNARCTDKRRGVAFIGDSGAGKTALCAHVAAKYRVAKDDEGNPLFSEVVQLTYTSAWRSEQAFYTKVAQKMGIAGSPWRGIHPVQTAVGEELLQRGKVLFVVDEFQADHNSIFAAFKWLENETPARWFIAGNETLYDRMIGNEKMFPNADQFRQRTLPIYRFGQVREEDVEPFVRSFEAQGAKLEEPLDAIVQRVTHHAREFGRLNLVADTLPKYIARDHGNRWSMASIDKAVCTVMALHGIDLGPTNNNERK